MRLKRLALVMLLWVFGPVVETPARGDDVVTIRAARKPPRRRKPPVKRKARKKAPRPPTSVESELHAERLSTIQRLGTVNDVMKDAELAAFINGLRQKEMTRHELVMQWLHKRAEAEGR